VIFQLILLCFINMFILHISLENIYIILSNNYEVDKYERLFVRVKQNYTYTYLLSYHELIYIQ